MKDPAAEQLWQGWATSSYEAKKEREKSVRVVALSRAIESLYETITIPHPTLPKTWVVKKVRKK